MFTHKAVGERTHLPSTHNREMRYSCCSETCLGDAPLAKVDFCSVRMFLKVLWGKQHSSPISAQGSCLAFQQRSVSALRQKSTTHLCYFCDIQPSTICAVSRCKKKIKEEQKFVHIRLSYALYHCSSKPSRKV